MSAFALRSIACVAMLLDHLGYCLGTKYQILRYIGRIAFPLYVFLVVNGFRHTHSKKRYALRLGLFALLSQVPFSLLFHKTAFDPRLNAFASLLFALLAVWITDSLWKKPRLRLFSLLPALGIAALLYFNCPHTDYGAKGVLMALCFWAFDRHKVLYLPGMALALYHKELINYALHGLRWALGRAYSFALPKAWALAQSFSLLALPLIWLYNGKRGYTPKSARSARVLQLGFYVFYPLHMLVLYFLLRR